MRSTNPESLRGSFRYVAVLIAAGTATACGGSADARRETARADAERQFGRPVADTADAGNPAVVEPVVVAAKAAESKAAEVGPTGSGPPPDKVAQSTAPGAREELSGSVPSPSTPLPAGDTPSPVTPSVDPDAIMAGADEAYSALSSLRAEFVQRVDVPLLDRTSQGHGAWYQKGRNRFRMDFVDPPEDLFVADGEFLWLWQPSANPNQVIKSSLAGGTRAAGGADVLGRILSEARTSYDAVYDGRAIVSGVATQVITLTPRETSEYRLVRVWVAVDDRLVRRFRIEEENETIRTVTLADLEADVPLPDSLFVFHPPEGVSVFEP